LVDLALNKSQSSSDLQIHALYSLRGPLFLGRLGQAAGSPGSDNEPVSQALSSEDRSNASGMKTLACYQFTTGIWDSNAAIS
jgi:hypothetical protein